MKRFVEISSLDGHAALPNAALHLRRAERAQGARLGVRCNGLLGDTREIFSAFAERAHLKIDISPCLYWLTFAKEYFRDA